MRSFLSRVWLTAPVLVGVIAVPATLNVVTPGKAVWVLSTDPYWTITDSGLKAAGILVFRVGVSLSFAMLIAMTTKWNDFLGALRSLGFPKLFVMIVSLSYRYLGTLLRIASEMLLARRTRTVGKLSNDEGRRFIGRTFGALFGKSIKLSDDVHQAMLARGFDGQIRTLNPTRLRWADGLWSLSFVAVACLAILLNVSV